jgi:hypothetical protein
MPQSKPLLVAVSDELVEIRQRLEQLADLTGNLLVHCPPEKRVSAMAEVQCFDLLIQRLDGLSGLAAALGAGTPIETALHALTLSDLYDRLAGDDLLRTAAEAQAGELSLFD